MRALLQRVSHARVEVDGLIVGEIATGLLVLLGVDRDDSDADADKLVKKMLAYRIFPDAEGRMNRSVTDIEGEVLVVSQFTLSADTRKGLRPSFTSAAEPQKAELLYEGVLARVEAQLGRVSRGEFGANMQVSLCNDGPVTFLLET